jgi:hypothetical protein
VPTSVLLAVLTAAGLLALAPALVRRYDATERLVAERAISTARVLSRQRRRRTVPGRRPVNPPRWLTGDLPVEAQVSVPPAVPASLRLVVPGDQPPRARQPKHRPSVYRRRQVLASLALLNLVELAGVPLVGPGFLIPLTVTGPLLLLYLGHLRGQAVRAARRRRAEARQAAWLAEQQAQVRRAQRRRAAARREAARQLQEELLLLEEAYAEAALAAESSVETAPPPIVVQPRVATFSYRAGAQVARSSVRGRAYHAGPAA